MKAIADDRLYLYHMFSAIFKYNNGITVPNSSALIQQIANAKYPVLASTGLVMWPGISFYGSAMISI